MSNRSPRGLETDGTITKQNVAQKLGGVHGGDSVFLSANNIPAHTHPVNLTTDDGGNHSHTVYGSWGGPMIRTLLSAT